MGRLHYPGKPERRRVVALVYCGADAVKKVRAISGPTNPHNAREQAPGSIRALGTVVPIKDASGKVVSDRIDNLVHASANEADAEREIKLWFRPGEIMPYMHAYETVCCEEHFYYKDGKLFTTHEPGSFNVLAPGERAWKSDLDALRLLAAGKPASCTLECVAAKYMINQRREEE
jgi:nucleoside-diphosphate kinase